MNEGTPNLNLQPAGGVDSMTESDLRTEEGWGNNTEGSWKAFGKELLAEIVAEARPRVEAWVVNNLPKIQQIPGKLVSKFASFLTKKIPAKLRAVMEVRGADGNRRENWLEEETGGEPSQIEELGFEQPRHVEAEVDPERVEFEDRRSRLEGLLAEGVYDEGITNLVQRELEELAAREGERIRQKPLRRISELKDELGIALENANLRIDGKIAGIKERYGYDDLIIELGDIEEDVVYLGGQIEKAGRVISNYKQMLKSNSGVLKRTDKIEIKKRIEELEELQKEAQKELSRIQKQKTKILGKIAKANKKIRPWEELKKANLGKDEAQIEESGYEEGLERGSEEMLGEHISALNTIERMTPKDQTQLDSLQRLLPEIKKSLSKMKFKREVSEDLKLIGRLIELALKLKFPYGEGYTCDNYASVIGQRLATLKDNLK